MSRGLRLYETVERYAALGEHRTGTSVDAATAGWLGDCLRAIGAEVELDSWEFPPYDGSWDLHVYSEPVETLAAEIVAGRSANVIARLGDGSAGALLITTPTSGWFRCAGERGTGIAIALELTRVLAAEEVAVTLVATSGHELGGLGVQHHLRTHPVVADAILHIGASVAVRRPARSDRNPTDRLWLRTSCATLAAGSFPDDWDAQLVDDPSDAGNWAGEAKNWCTLGLPLLSLAGMFPLFHTPDDLPHLATSPDLLDATCERVLDLARRLVR